MDQDASPTTEMTEPPPPPPQDDSPPRPQPAPSRSSMVRSLADRKLSGVSSALAGLLGTSVTTARVVFVIGAFFGGIGLIAYALLWLFVPDEQGRVLVRGGARDGTEAALAAITTAIAAAIAASWTFDDTGPLVPLLVGIGVYILSRNNGATTTPVPPSTPPPPDTAAPSPSDAPTASEDAVASTAGEPAEASTHDQPGPGYGPPPVGPPPGEPPLYAAQSTPPVPPPPPPRAPAFLGPLAIGVAALVAGLIAVLHATEPGSTDWWVESG